MPDLPIVIPDTAAAPKDYTLSGTQELALKTVRALIDGSGAASAFLPTLQLLDPNGHVMWEGATSEAVAAGASADVSWFPGLGASGASTGVQWFFASRFSAFTVPLGSSHAIPWTHTATSDSTVFTVTTTSQPNDTVNCLKAGVYIAFTNCIWAAPQTFPAGVQINSGFFNVSVAANTPVSDATTAADPAGQATNVNDAALLITNAVPGHINVLARNFDGAPHDLSSAQYGIAYLPNSVLVT